MTASITVSRRSAVKLVGGLMLAAGCTAALPGAAGAAEADEPLRVGVNGTPESALDPALGSASMWTQTVAHNTMDTLAVLTGEGIEYRLATSIEMNDDATEWTIVIRDDAVFHNGEPVTADDVLYSLSYLAANPAGMMGYANVDFAASTSDGAQTVVLHLAQPQATLLEEGLAIMSLIFPEGTVSEDFGTDIGSGPYRLMSCSAETGAALEAFEGHWAGAPAIKNVEIVPIADAATRMTALQAGQIAFANTVSATDAATAPAGIEVLPGEAAHSSAFVFSLNCAMAPFDDPEVRRAFKQAVDRDQLVQTLFRGQGEAGNDVLGKGLPSYNDAMEQTAYDPDTAAELFAAKGVTELTILTSEITPGIRDSATLLAQQLQKVGVTLNVSDIDAAALFSTSFDQISQHQIFATYLINRPFPAMASLYTSAQSMYNYSQWADDAYNDLLNQAIAEPDADERTALWNEVEQMLHEEGGLVVWGYQYELNAQVEGLTGVQIIQSVPLMAQATLA